MQRFRSLRWVLFLVLGFVLPLLFGSQAYARVLVTNQAQLEWSEETVLSNRVTIQRNAADTEPAQLAFYDSDNYQQTVTRQSVGDQLYLQLVAPGCNAASDEIEQVAVSLSSAGGADQETAILTETAANSGRFRFTGETAEAPSTHHNGILEMVVDDRLVAEVVSCESARQLTAVILVDPMGIVFDSRTSQPIAGATVRLIDVTGNGNGGRPGQAAVVFAEDGRTPAPSTVVTGDDGHYQFPLVAESQYRLEITPPDGYSFPSVFTPAQLPSDREVVAGSYGASFPVSEATGLVTIDVPLDQALFGLVADITASPTIIGVGGFTQITLTGRNLLGTELSAGQLQLELPVGFNFVPDSALLNGVAVTVQQQGRRLIIDVGNVAEGGLETLTFLLTASANANSSAVSGWLQGNVGSEPQQSNVARVQLQVQDSFGQGYVFGKVFADCDQNRQQSAEEVGVPGIRLYLQNGDWVVTDSEGKFSFEALPPRLYVLRLDPASLPKGAEMAVLSPAFAGDAQSRFVDLTKNELHKANFAIEHCHQEVMNEIALRRYQHADRQPDQQLIADTIGSDNALLPPQQLRQRIQRSRANAQTQVQAQVQTGGTQDHNQAAQVNPELVRDEHAIPRRADEAFPNDNQADFLNLHDDQVVVPGPALVTVKGPLGAELGLLVNDVPVASKQMSQRQTQHSTAIQVLEYRGIQLQPGRNRLELVVLDAFGNQRDSRVIHVTAPGRVVNIQLQGKAHVISDGNTPSRYQIHLLDQHKVRVDAPATITLESNLGRWLVKDADPLAPGLQVALGAEHYEWLPPASGSYPANAKPLIRARYGALSDELQVRVEAAPQRLFINGLAEVGLSQNNPAANTFSDAEEPQLEDDDWAASGRVAVYAEGNVSADWHIQARYDNQQRDSELFRQQRPEQFQPIYGDAASRGSEAQSSDDLYLRLQGQGQTLQWGDFGTQFSQPGEQISALREVATGYRGWHQFGAVELQSYAAQTEGQQQNQELAADGTSGPYTLSNVPIVTHSELIEVIERDRNALNTIVARRPLIRNVDYRIDPESGQIFLRDALPSLSPEQLNPQSLLVSYRTVSVSNDGTMWGLGMSVPLASSVSVNAAVHQQNSDVDSTERRIYGANIHWQPSQDNNSRATLEWAQTDEQQQDAQAWRLAWEQQLTKQLQLKVRWLDADEGFQNSGAGVIAGSQEQQLELDWSTGAGQWSLNWLSQQNFDRRRQRIGVDWKQQWGSWVGTIGLRQQYSETATVENDSAQAVLGLQRQFAQGKALLGIDYIQDLGDRELRYARLQGHWKPVLGTRLYFNHQLTDSLGNDSFFNSSVSQQATQVGIETDWLGGAQAFSEYRIRDAIAGQQAEAAYGIRNTWALSKGMKLGGRAERVTVLTGDVSNENTAISVSLDYKPSERWHNVGKLEWRDSNQGQRWFVDLASSTRLNPSLSATLAARHVDDQSLTRPSEVSQLRAGLAWRPVNNDQLNSLFNWRWRQGKGDTPLLGTRRSVDWYVNWQPDDDWLASGFYLHRYQSLNHAGSAFEFSLDALGGRGRYSLTERWSLGVQLALAKDSSNQYQRSYGVMAERVLAANISIAAGFNVEGFSGSAIEDESLQTGAWLRLQIKFDENSFGLGARHDH